MPHIVVLATGGTISSRAVSSGGAVATDSAEAVVGGARLASDVVVEPIDLLRKNSFNLSMHDLRTIMLGIDAQLARPEVDAIVVTHGTDTVEESAFLADLVHRDARPVVFTGSQLAADHESSDGPRNLREAIAVAAAPSSRGAGVLVSFAGDIFAARGIRKQHSLAMAPFGAAASGPIGHVIGGGVEYHARPVRSEPFALPSERFADVRVDTLMTYPGVDGALLRAAVAVGAQGIVVAGSGTGNTNPALVAAIAEASARGVVVALGSRTAGPVLPLYGGGGAVDAVAAGAVPTGSLPLAQARILLALLLEQFPAEVAASRLAQFCADHTRSIQSSNHPFPS